MDIFRYLHFNSATASFEMTPTWYQRIVIHAILKLAICLKLAFIRQRIMTLQYPLTTYQDQNTSINCQLIRNFLSMNGGGGGPPPGGGMDPLLAYPSTTCHIDIVTYKKETQQSEGFSLNTSRLDFSYQCIHNSYKGWYICEPLCGNPKKINKESVTFHYDRFMLIFFL